MSEATPTPGPWTTHEEPGRQYPDGEVDHGGYRIDAYGIEQLAFVWRDSKRWGDDPTPFGAAEAEANARLIAAAPDLLSALKETVEQANAMAYERLTQDYEEMGPPDYILRARAAIAAATGE